ncbi:unnamed protein product [Blepharisma stoltei]|uniref:Transposase n=1 Tax=Blepharisma stoltei TaxID=1481888 RepID=A0AAU9J9U7_9CILI|nr:unnamed protein product [Blepharisma stoltei]
MIQNMAYGERLNAKQIQERLAACGKDMSLTTIRHYTNKFNPEEHTLELRRKLVDHGLSPPPKKIKWNDGESIVKRIIDVGFFKNEELATILGTSKRTIERIAAENTESESDEAAGREEALSRSPLKHWSDEDFAEVIKECEKDTGFVSKASLRAQFKRKTVDISEEQLGKELKKRGYVYRKKRVVLQLTEAHKEQRMSWARSLIDSDIASWIFSDECCVHLFRNSNLSWCKEGINATIEEPINWKTSIMIWGGKFLSFLAKCSS